MQRKKYNQYNRYGFFEYHKRKIKVLMIMDMDIFKLINQVFRTDKASRFQLP
jgi:hypothetical protein